MSEKQLERWFTAQVRLRGGWTGKWAPVERGTPDRVVLMPGGRIFLVELKTLDGRLSRIQMAWHHRAAELGTDVVVLYGREGAQAWLDSL